LAEHELTTGLLSWPVMVTGRSTLPVRLAAQMGLPRPHPVARIADVLNQGTATLWWLFAGCRGMGLGDFMIDVLRFAL